MNRAAYFISLILFIFLVPFAYSHDPALHKGKPTHGTVLSVDAKGFRLKTEEGLLQVFYGKDLNVEIGDAESSKDQIKPGLEVDVRGVKTGTSEFMAKEVLILDAESRTENKVPESGNNFGDY